MQEVRAGSFSCLLALSNSTWAISHSLQSSPLLLSYKHTPTPLKQEKGQLTRSLQKTQQGCLLPLLLLLLLPLLNH